jgi:ribosomal subunit interface protein
MKISITGRHLEISEAARAQIEKKVGRIDRLLRDSAVSAQCAFWEERGAYVCEVTVHARADHMLHAVARSPRLPVAVSLAVARLAQQAKKLADRWKTRRRAPVVARRRTTVRKARQAARPAEPEA